MSIDRLVRIEEKTVVERKVFYPAYCVALGWEKRHVYVHEVKEHAHRYGSCREHAREEEDGIEMG